MTSTRKAPEPDAMENVKPKEGRVPVLRLQPGTSNPFRQPVTVNGRRIWLTPGELTPVPKSFMEALRGATEPVFADDNRKGRQGTSHNFRHMEGVRSRFLLEVFGWLTPEQYAEALKLKEKNERLDEDDIFRLMQQGV